MEVYLAVAETGGFVTAGAKLGRSPPTVTRAIAALEDGLGVQLLNRTTRRLCLTEAGSRYFESTRRLLGEIKAAEQMAAGETSEPSGHLTVTCSRMFGQIHLVELVAEFLRQNPRITASVLLLDRVVDLVNDGVDVAFRICVLPDSSLVASRVGEMRRLLVAAPEYMDRRGRLERPADLRTHDVIAFSGLISGREVFFVGSNGRAVAMELSPRLRVNYAVAAIAAAQRGDGICMALSYMVASSLRDGRLTAVLEPFMPPAVPIQIVYPPARLLAPKIRAFIDFAAPRLRSSLAVPSQ